LLKVESRKKSEKEKINKKGSPSDAKQIQGSPLVPGISSTILIILSISHYVKMAVIVYLATSCDECSPEIKLKKLSLVTPKIKGGDVIRKN
jgi:hypothetical protein